MAITQETIQEETKKLGEMIARFESIGVNVGDAKAWAEGLLAKLKASAATVLTLPGIEITLAPGERYAGLLLDEEGKPSHHLVLLPGEFEDVSWDAAKSAAEKVGGELPSRREQSLLFANLKSEFKAAWYWSSEQASSGDAWRQHFGYGYQDDYYEEFEGRARLVRRLVL
ncbi:DUF1566 domain-containing protein [Variovorax sp. ZT5P49]|uniref:DUF1566 domain-containing protein n=1 Tax=Variovorax sp. ZT5P49 TaxID=3443733 RepID=UPI003F46CD46